jgi:bifunctional ADP-heptose synthase (sugar kinase/adenylyltransferase)
MQLARQYKVLLIGDSCADEWVYGNCDRLSPEAPVPVLVQSGIDTAPGMAGNVKQNLESLGITVNFVTNTEALKKTRYIDSKSNQQIVRVDTEPDVGALHPSQLQMALLHDTYDAIIISDYNKGFLPDTETIKYIAGRYPNTKVFVDTKKTKLPVEFSNVIYKINQREFEALDPNFIPNRENMIVTMGGDGAVWNKKKFPCNDLVRTFDVTGAGDTFLAALVFYYIQLPFMEECIAFANKAAAVAVQNPGTYTLRMDDVDRILGV